MEHIVVIDLHSNNGYYGIIEPNGNRVFQRRLANNLLTVLRTIEPYHKTVSSVVVESTYNWKKEKSLGRSAWRRFRRRAAIEPMFGHLKTDN